MNPPEYVVLFLHLQLNDKFIDFMDEFDAQLKVNTYYLYRCR